MINWYKSKRRVQGYSSMTVKNKEKISSWDRHVTVNISIPLKILAAIDEKATAGKRS